MKTNSVSTRVVKTISAIVAVIVLFVSNPLSSQANGINDKKPSGLTEGQVSVKYVGSDDNNVIFSVKFENPNADKFWLIVKNDVGDVIYRQQFTDVHFSKSLFLEKDASEIHPTFVIRKGNDEITHRFVVNRTLTENVVVTKL
ncbi:MAG TPA: hypothetical protein VK563_10060 [Puia sp.]|nr:hypothetical protein [Puia sp.]